MLPEEFARCLAAAQTGAEWALGELYRVHQPRVLAYLRSAAPASTGVLASPDDLASETWLVAARTLPGFSGDEDAFRGWLFTIARRQLADARRKHARRRTAPVAPADLPVPATDDRLLAERVATRAVLDLLAQLPPAQAEVLRLRMIADLDTGTVARLVGRRPGTVRVLAHRGLRRLEQLLTAQDQRPGPGNAGDVP